MVLARSCRISVSKYGSAASAHESDGGFSPFRSRSLNSFASAYATACTVGSLCLRFFSTVPGRNVAARLTMARVVIVRATLRACTAAPDLTASAR